MLVWQDGEDPQVEGVHRYVLEFKPDGYCTAVAGDCTKLFEAGGEFNTYLYDHYSEIPEAKPKPPYLTNLQILAWAWGKQKHSDDVHVFRFKLGREPDHIEKGLMGLLHAIDSSDKSEELEWNIIRKDCGDVLWVDWKEFTTEECFNKEPHGAYAEDIVTPLINCAPDLTLGTTIPTIPKEVPNSTQSDFEFKLDTWYETLEDKPRPFKVLGRISNKDPLIEIAWDTTPIGDFHRVEKKELLSKSYMLSLGVTTKLNKVPEIKGNKVQGTLDTVSTNQPGF
jgi:hypothetical protein